MSKCSIYQLILIAAVATGILGACGEIEPAPPVDDEGEPIPLPDPHDEWLQFIDIQPRDELSLRPTIEVTFNAYLDPRTFTTYGALRLESGGLINSGIVDYRMTRKTLVFRTNSELYPDLEYRLIWRADNVRSVTGSPLHSLALLPQYRSNEELAPTAPISRPTVVWDDVEEIFDDHCNQCHSDPDWMLPELSRDGLVGRRSEQVDALLVEPLHPARSYLMHKILPDYPTRKFTVQPPPWSEQSPLTLEEIERIEHWIASGAPR